MQVNYQETHKDLQKRIDLHSLYGNRDIDAWMIEVLNPEKGTGILDVACGAGKQREAFHMYLSADAEIASGDVSEAVLAR